jgi:hypothetical protein
MSTKKYSRAEISEMRQRKTKRPNNLSDSDSEDSDSSEWTMDKERERYRRYKEEEAELKKKLLEIQQQEQNERDKIQQATNIGSIGGGAIGMACSRKCGLSPDHGRVTGSLVGSQCAQYAVKTPAGVKIMNICGDNLRPNSDSECNNCLAKGAKEYTWYNENVSFPQMVFSKKYWKPEAVDMNRGGKKTRRKKPKRGNKRKTGRKSRGKRTKRRRKRTKRRRKSKKRRT